MTTQTTQTTQIPGYQALKLAHQPVFSRYLQKDPPRVSELTFTNLLMWSHVYRPLWAEVDGCLSVVMQPEGKEPFGLMPFGGGDQAAALDRVMSLLTETWGRARVERADRAFVESMVDPSRYAALPDRDQWDYVYLAQELARLPGRRFHRKKNHLNRFKKTQDYQYRPLDKGLVGAVLDMQSTWCQLRDCGSDQSLDREDQAIFEAFCAYDEMGYVGGAILVGGAVEAFTIGEMLNGDTAVIHVEKANSEIPGLYAAINQMFVEHAWQEAEFINREQDLGIPGLRNAKESYHPHHMVEKYSIVPL